MRKTIGVVASLLLLAGFAQAADKNEPKETKGTVVLNHKMKGIDGKDVDLAQYKGKVVLFVNVASKCGYTKQYDGLQKLYEKYGKDGLVIVGVPSNEFGGQEPGSDAEIADFCASKFSVKFPMLSKVKVNGKEACDLYKELTSKETNPKFSGEIKWNFTKFMVGKNGEVVNRFESEIAPKDMAKAIEEELAKK